MANITTESNQPKKKSSTTKSKTARTKSTAKKKPKTPSKKSQKANQKSLKTVVRSLWLFLLVVIAMLCFLFVAIAKGWIGYMPPISELQNPKNKFATEIISSDLQSLGTFHTASDNRINVQFSEISPYLIQALIATEDVRYTEHSGIDSKALARVIILRAILQRNSAGGGSTITQQLAKQLYSPPAKNIIDRAKQKLIEWVISVQLEKLYTKEEIITMYLNKFDFLYNAIGIETASKVYFDKKPIELNLEESAVLVAMFKNPSYYNPVSKLSKPRNLKRRNVVLSQMEKAGYISQAVKDSIQQLPLTLKFTSADHKSGLAPYFREHLRQMLTAKEPKLRNYNKWQRKRYGKYYMDSIAWAENPLYGFCAKNKKKDGSHYNIYQDGLKIYTTIDYRMQTYAENAVKMHFRDLQAHFNYQCAHNKKKAPFAWDTEQSTIDASMKRAMIDTDLYRSLRKSGRSKEEITKIFNEKHEMQLMTYAAPEDTAHFIIYVDTVLSPLDSLRHLKSLLQCGMMSMEPTTGYVKAYVGGPDFTHFQYDMASTGRRQVGSTVKPFLYTQAMLDGYWPCDSTINKSYTLYDKLGRPFTPRNSSKKNIDEYVSFKWGLQNSNNWIAAYVMSLITPEQMLNLMRSFGIKGFIEPTVSLCLGPCEVSVEEMVSAYTTFPNNGIRSTPVYVTRIEDNMGNVIGDFHADTHEVIDQLTCKKMITMMKGTADQGTAIRLRYRYNIQAPIGAKTGTTQKNADGWFMGYTPQLVTGVWTGWQDRSVHFHRMLYGQGASMALPIWALYMQQVYADKDLGYDPKIDFPILKGFNPNQGCMPLDQTPEHQTPE